MTVIDVPALDLAPTVPSRIVYGTVLIPTEDRGPTGEWIEATIPGEIKLPGEHATITGRSKRFPVNPDGSFQLRLPTYAEGIEPEDWALSMRLSWRRFAFPMRVPAGDDPIWIEDCIFPELVPGEEPSKYFLSGAQIRSVQTLPPGASASARADVVGGVLSIDLSIPQGPQGLPGVTAIEGDEAVAGYIATQGQSATRDALMTTLTEGGTRPVGKGEIVLNARDMGATGNGSVDDTAALQAALDQSAGRDVFLPHGRYRITDTLTVPSGGVVRGENGTVIVNDADLSTMIDVNGNVGPERPIAATVGTNDRTITTTVAHGFEAGDIVQFKSQRISTSEDAGEWRLGFSTGSSPGPFFGEFGTVQNVINATTFTLDAGLIYPDYRPDNSRENDPAARERATVAKIDGARNVLISTLELEGPSYIAIRGRRAVDLRIENVRYMKYDTGRFIQFFECYRSVATDCWVSNEVDVTPDLDHAAVNSYHITASQSTGFDSCTAISGTQAFDITYSNTGRIPSSFCYVRNSSSYAALNNSMTVHPGTYAPIIVGNNFSENQGSGISIRGNRAIVTGNVVRGSGGGTGLYFMEAGGKDSLASGNHISNFENGLAVRDGAGKNFEGWIGITFADNYVVDCLYGYRRSSGWQAPLPSGPQGITLSGNTFTSALANAVGVETSQGGRAIWGLTIQGNTFRLTGGSTTAAILLRGNSRGVAVLGNTIWRAGAALDFNPYTESNSWGSVRCVAEFTGNIVHEQSRFNTPTPEGAFVPKSQDVEPHVIGGGSWHLNDFTETIAFRMSTSANVSAARGFPIDGVTCDVQVVKHTDSYVTQQVNRSGVGEMYHRRLNGTSWSAWSQRY